MPSHTHSTRSRTGRSSSNRTDKPKAHKKSPVASDRVTRQSSRVVSGSKRPASPTASEAPKAKRTKKNGDKKGLAMSKPAKAHAQVPRRPAIEIPSDSSSSDSSDSSSDDKDDDAKSVSNDSEDDDLLEMSGESLRSQLEKERIKVPAAASRALPNDTHTRDVSPPLLPQLGNPEEEPVNGKPDRNLSTQDSDQSHSSSESDVDSDSNSDSDSSSSDEEDHLLTTRRGTDSKRRNESSRDKARRLEKPQFQDTKTHTSRSHRRSQSDTLSRRRHPSDVNAGWPAQAHYVPILPNARSLSIRSQPLPLRQTIQAAIRQELGDLAFGNAFPDTGTEAFNKYHRNVLVKSAKDLGHRKLASRLRRDPEIVKPVASVINSRAARLRTDCKEVTDGAVTGFYLGTTPADQVKQRLVFLITEMNYIYPTKDNSQASSHEKDSYCRNLFYFQSLNTDRPYCHPAIIATIKQCFFLNERGSIANNHASRFTSSIDTEPGKSELEVPIPMVCLVSAMIHASLQMREDSEVGSQSSKGFRTEQYDHIYRSHHLFLETLRGSHRTLPIFHSVMHELYMAVCRSKSTTAATFSQRAMARLTIPSDDTV
ncbi:hypothetical protein ONZ45_g8473 [Pleurotus djamor]|nr:hypothetical protein ONZ45_g8473 [Pleurotus djamor]